MLHIIENYKKLFVATLKSQEVGGDGGGEPVKTLANTPDENKNGSSLDDLLAHYKEDNKIDRKELGQLGEELKDLTGETKEYLKNLMKNLYIEMLSNGITMKTNKDFQDFRKNMTNIGISLVGSNNFYNQFSKAIIGKKEIVVKGFMKDGKIQLGTEPNTRRNKTNNDAIFPIQIEKYEKNIPKSLDKALEEDKATKTLNDALEAEKITKEKNTIISAYNKLVVSKLIKGADKTLGLTLKAKLLNIEEVDIVALKKSGKELNAQNIKVDKANSDYKFTQKAVKVENSKKTQEKAALVLEAEEKLKNRPYVSIDTTIFEKTLRFGSRGPDVKALQIFLGFTNTTEYFGSHTEAYLKAYQKISGSKGKNADGVLTISKTREFNTLKNIKKDVAKLPTNANTVSKGKNKVTSNTEKKNINLSPIEKKFNAEIQKSLNPKTHIFLELPGGEIMVMSGGAEEKKLVLEMEKNFGNDDKLAVQTILQYISKNRKNIKTVTEIYAAAGSRVNGMQGVIGKNNDRALLDAAFDTDVSTIEIDDGNAFLNVTGAFFTAGLGGDTESIASDTIKDNSEGRNATSADYLDGGKGFDAYKRSNKEALIKKLATTIEGILKDNTITEEELKTPEGKLAMAYVEDADFTKKQMRAGSVVMAKNFKNDDNIAKYLAKLDNLFPGKPAITVTENGFVSIDRRVLGTEANQGIVKIELQNAREGENVEVFMKKTLVSFEELGLKGVNGKDIPDDIAPIIFEKHGMVMQVTKEGVYVVSESTKDIADSMGDWIQEHEMVTAAIAGGIVGALLVKGVSISPIIDDVSKFIKDINSPKLNINIKGIHISGAAAAYFLTFIPMKLKIDALQYQLNELKAEGKTVNAFEGALSHKKINSEDISYLNKMISKKNTEGRNEVMHQAINNTKLFEAGAALKLDLSDVKKDGNQYLLTLNGKGKDTSFVKGGETYYVKSGEQVIITFDKNLGNAKVLSGKVMRLDTFSDNEFDAKSIITDKVVKENTKEKDDKKKKFKLKDPK